MARQWEDPSEIKILELTAQSRVGGSVLESLNVCTGETGDKNLKAAVKTAFPLKNLFDIEDFFLGNLKITNLISLIIVRKLKSNNSG